MIYLLIFAALLPAILMLRYIYRKDKIEKEPIGLIALLVLGGVLAIIPAIIMEMIGEKILYLLLPENILITVVIDNFLIIALSEELCKQFVAKKLTWNNKAFNYRFDAIVYGATSALGFAAFENILYVLDGGFAVAATRAILSIPLHGFCGVFMGLYLGHAKACECMENIAGKKRHLKMSLWIPVLFHGFYDLCLSINNILLFLLFPVFVVTLYIISFRSIKRAAAKDCPLSVNWNESFHK